MSTQERFNKASDFLKAYIVTALWTGVERPESDPEHDRDKDYDANPGDLTPEAFDKMESDCTRFLMAAQPHIDAAIATGKVQCGPDFDEIGRAGHDFWLTRNGHGAGFWDGDWPEPMASELDRIAKGFSECDLYRQDDGTVAFV